jgi:hypothetical protein
VTKPGASWERFPRKLASPSSNGSISASCCWKPLTVNFLIDLNPTQLRTNINYLATLQPATPSLTG